jgi:hypothetical protein
VVESTLSIGIGICGHPRESVCPKPPLQRDGICDEVRQKWCESAFILVFVCDYKSAGLLGEFEYTASLCEREALRFIDGSAFRTDKLAERRATALTCQLLIYVWKYLFARITE